MKKLRTTIHERYIAYRAIDVLLSLPVTEMLWEASTDDLKSKLTALALAGDRYGVTKWIKTHPAHNLSELSVRILRLEAQKEGIKNYSRMTKIELIEALEWIRRQPATSGVI